MRGIALAAVSLALCAALGAGGQGESRSAQNPAPGPVRTPRQSAELRADILLARKLYSEAIAAYLELLKQEPRDAALLNKIGVAYQQESSLKEASRYYHRAIKADKNFASAINNLGTIEYNYRKYRKAIRFYQKALAIRSDEPAYYSNLGYACLAGKQFDQALAAFRKVAELDPAFFESRGSGGTVMSERSMPDPALLYFFLAKTYALAGDAQRCAHYLKLARDEGYKGLAEAGKDPAFARVVNDPRVREILEPSPPPPADAPTSPGSAGVLSPLLRSVYGA